MFKIGKIAFSFPVLKYKTQVSYSTPRSLLNFEWLILKTLEASDKNEYSNLSVNQLFNSLFCIPETEKLLRPVLVQLKDDDIIRIDNFCDGLTLDNLYFKDIKITERGKNIMSKGYYPGKAAYNKIDLFYNPSTDVVSNYSENYADEPSGLITLELDNTLLEIAPIHQMMDLLEKCKRPGKLGQISWLHKDINIDNIEVLGEPDIVWENKNKPLSIDENMELHIPECPVELASQAIKDYLLSGAEKKVGKNLPLINKNYKLSDFKRIKSISEFTESEMQFQRCATFDLKFNNEQILVPMVYELKVDSTNKINEKTSNKGNKKLNDTYKSDFGILKAA